jgi:hypothetical protein
MAGTTVSATATGGSPGDTVTETQYSVPPVPALGDGTNFFDVAASATDFAKIVINDCENVTSSTLLYWYNPNSLPAAKWQLVEIPSGNTTAPYGQNNNGSCVSASLTAASSPTPAELTGTVFASAPITGPAITSYNQASATVG